MATDPMMEQYDAARYRISSLVEAAPMDRLQELVPACPEWTANMVVRHLAGLAMDWAEGKLHSYGATEWTERQIARFDGEPTQSVLSQWSQTMPSLMALGEVEGMGRPSMWLFGDALVHEADLRPLLDPETFPPAEAVALATKAGIARLRQHLGEAGTEPLEIHTASGRTWAVGDISAFHNDVEVDGYELFRALYGRRSASQVRSWGWTGDPEPYIEAGLPYPFVWAEEPLTD